MEIAEVVFEDTVPSLILNGKFNSPTLILRILIEASNDTRQAVILAVPDGPFRERNNLSVFERSNYVFTQALGRDNIVGGPLSGSTCPQRERYSHADCYHQSGGQYYLLLRHDFTSFIESFFTCRPPPARISES